MQQKSADDASSTLPSFRLAAHMGLEASAILAPMLVAFWACLGPASTSLSEIERNLDETSSGLNPIFPAIMLGMVMLAATLAAAEGLGLSSALGDWLKASIKNGLVLGISASVQDAKLSIIRGTVVLHDVVFDNPEGFETESLAKIGTLSCRIRRLPLFLSRGKTWIFDDLALDGVTVVLETSTTSFKSSNIYKTLQNLQAERARRIAKNGGKPKRTVSVSKVTLNKVSLEHVSKMLGAVSADLGDLEYCNPQQVSGEELVAGLINAVLNRSLGNLSESVWDMATYMSESLPGLNTVSYLAGEISEDIQYVKGEINDGLDKISTGMSEAVTGLMEAADRYSGMLWSALEPESEDDRAALEPESEDEPASAEPAGEPETTGTPTELRSLIAAEIKAMDEGEEECYEDLVEPLDEESCARPMTHVDSIPVSTTCFQPEPHPQPSLIWNADGLSEWCVNNAQDSEVAPVDHSCVEKTDDSSSASSSSEVAKMESSDASHLEAAAIEEAASGAEVSDTASSSSATGSSYSLSWLKQSFWEVTAMATEAATEVAEEAADADETGESPSGSQAWFCDSW